MKLFKKKEPPPVPYDRETQQPAVRAGVCTGELAVGFVDGKTGKFLEYALARGQSDVDAFCRRVGIEPESIKHIY